jgi:hypothetical protein
MKIDRSNIVAEACILSVLPKLNSCMRFNLSGQWGSLYKLNISSVYFPYWLVMCMKSMKLCGSYVLTFVEQ